MQIQAFDWLSVWQFSAQLSSFLSLQYLKFSEVIWFLRRNSCKIIILFWHFPYQKQNLFRKLFLLLLLSPIDSKLSNPYTKHVYLNIMFFNISLLGFALKMIAHFTGWGYFWTFSRFLGILGTPWDHPGGSSLVFRDMGSQQKKTKFIIFSTFKLTKPSILPNCQVSNGNFLHVENYTNSNISGLLGDLERYVSPI